VNWSALRGRRALIVAPHPDDEAIGAWELLRRLRRERAQIEVVVVTDGGASHPGSKRWPPDRLIRERRRETCRAVRDLGLPPSAIRFLGLPDGGLPADPAAVRRALCRAVGRGPRPALIVGPEAADAHGDHRAVASALASLPRRGERRIGYHVWPEGAAQGVRPVRITLDGRSLALKRRIVRSYRTQTGIITDAVGGFAMNHRHLRAFVRPTERFAVLR